MKHEDALQLAKHALEDLAHSLEQGHSQTLTQFLKIMARFPRYSFRNVMLILAQRAEATHVAGFRSWQQLGRQVLKGEKGIAIFAPLVGCKSASDQPLPRAENACEPARLLGFRVVHVFDISQTEGAELPELTAPGGDPGDAIGRLEAAIGRLGISLEYEPLPGSALGWSLKGSIIVRPDLVPAERFAVLAHELAHELLHKPSDRPRPSKMVRELEAEAVAHAVCSAFGIDTSQSSSDYIQLYAGGTEALNQSLQAIQATAAQIIVEMAHDVPTPHLTDQAVLAA